MKTLMALLDILGCRMEELIEPVRATGQQRKTASGETAATADTSEPGVGSFRPKPARIL